jgi:hypothetical protein
LGNFLSKEALPMSTVVTKNRTRELEESAFGVRVTNDMSTHVGVCLYVSSLKKIVRVYHSYVFKWVTSLTQARLQVKCIFVIKEAILLPPCDKYRQEQ